MKKIVKCILPIVSSAALSAPVMISCGESYKALPREAFEINAGQIIGLRNDFHKWSKYDTLTIGKDITGVVIGGLVGNDGELNTIKHMRFEKPNFFNKANGVKGFAEGSLSDMTSLEDIVFTRDGDNFPIADGALKGKYPHLNVLDFSVFETLQPFVMNGTMFSNFLSEDHEIPAEGTIYIHHNISRSVIEDRFSMLNEDSPFQFWDIVIKK